jgi:integrase/recombinase XerC
MLFDKAIETYINWKAVYSPSAAKRYKTRLLKMRSYFADKAGLMELHNDDITRFHKAMESEGYSRATIAYSLTICKNFCGFWQKRGETKIDASEIKSITFTNRIKPVVTPDDFRRLSKGLSEYQFRELQIKLAIHLLWDTGMRVSELTDLKLSDINDPNEEGIRTAQLISKKSARYNLVAWSKETDELLCMYLGVRLSDCNSTDALLVDCRRKRSRPVDARTIQRWVKVACKKVGITKAISPHSFRHGKAHQMLNNGANIRDVQAVLRHINPITTFHYLAMNQKQFLEVAGRHLNPLTP